MPKLNFYRMSTKPEVQETLTFLRAAHKAKDGQDGFLCLHAWATGFQELIFPTVQAAIDFRNKLNTPEYQAQLKQPANF